MVYCRGLCFLFVAIDGRFYCRFRTRPLLQKMRLDVHSKPTSLPNSFLSSGSSPSQDTHCCCYTDLYDKNCSGCVHLLFRHRSFGTYICWSNILNQGVLVAGSSILRLVRGTCFLTSCENLLILRSCRWFLWCSFFELPHQPLPIPM